MDYDLLVIGGGTAGMESAILAGDMGFSVLLVEKDPTIGGKMILLSKVFPTLDCASCIATPKMASTYHHPKVDVMTYAELMDIKKNGSGTFQASINKKATYVNFAECTGCQKCEQACTVAIPDQYNYNLVARRAAYIPFPQAIPKKALIEKNGASPCIHTCPAGIKAHGYVSLIRQGLYEEAMELVLETTPIVGSLGRTCYAPCEGECTRGDLEGSVPIRRLKRFVADDYYSKYSKPKYGPPEKILDKHVAVVGSGPAGLTAAYHLAKKGYQVTIFEAEKEPGGMLRVAIPAYRLPKEVLDRDIKNVTALGVKIKTGHHVNNLKDLKDEGFDAIFLACGAMKDSKMGIEGEELNGVNGALTFLMDINRGKKLDLTGKKVVVIGGGDVAIDAARVARRLGAKVTIQYRRSRVEMPAFEGEVKGAEEEGVEIQFLKAPMKFVGESGKLNGIQCIDMKLGEPDASGRRRPMPVEGSEKTIAADLCIIAIGQTPDLTYLADKGKLKFSKWNTLEVDPVTYQTSISFVFAGGDLVSGPSTVVEAINTGVRGAEYIDRFLKQEDFPGKPQVDLLAAIDKMDVLKRQEKYTTAPPVGVKELPVQERVDNFREVELPLTEEEARYSASRCLDCGGCSECQQCIQACPADAINFDMRDEEVNVEVGSVIIATGFQLFDPTCKILDTPCKVQYGFGDYPNVITAMQMDRLLSPTRPYNTVLRPSDGKVPDNIAFILCAGSRNHQINNPFCSRVCCMYSIKQAQLLMGALPLAEITVYYIDIRAFGKGFEEFYQQASGMGTYFKKGKIAKIEETENSNLLLLYEDMENGGELTKTEHDLVVLSVGMMPIQGIEKLFSNERLETDSYGYIKQAVESLSPAKTNIEGVFVGGSAAAVQDIPDTIIHSGACAVQAAAYIERLKK